MVVISKRDFVESIERWFGNRMFKLYYLKAALDTCSHYVCIYLKGMHELRRSRPTTNEILKKDNFIG